MSGRFWQVCRGDLLAAGRPRTTSSRRPRLSRTLRTVPAIGELQSDFAQRARAEPTGGADSELQSVLFAQPYCRIATVMDRCGVSRPAASSWLNSLAGCSKRSRLGAICCTSIASFCSFWCEESPWWPRDLDGSGGNPARAGRAAGRPPARRRRQQRHPRADGDQHRQRPGSRLSESFRRAARPQHPCNRTYSQIFQLTF